jgi:hypothetical protein
MFGKFLADVDCHRKVPYASNFIQDIKPFVKMIRGLADSCPSVGSYCTRNVVEVIEWWFWERPTDCLVLCLCLSSILRGIPFSWGIRLALSLQPY